MAKLYIKKFRLIADGVSYEAGSVVELADAEAERLTKEAPDEFEIIADAASEKQEETASSKKKSRKKSTESTQDEGEELLDGLPPVDMNGIVK